MSVDRMTGDQARFDELLRLRTESLLSLGADPGDVGALLDYNEGGFDSSGLDRERFPLDDELHVPVWRRYADEVEAAGTISALANYLPQLRFPVKAGVSSSHDYVLATRRGIMPAMGTPACGLELNAPQLCRIQIHPTPAGRVPLLIVQDRQDFVSLIQAFTKRNEPVAIPDSMGACVVTGYNNWHRISVLRNSFLAGGGQPNYWAGEFTRIRAEKNLYQDCFILLSASDYSGIRAGELGLAPERWRNLSLVIRREHECAHYFTRRVFDSVRNCLLHEMIADYVGIRRALGRFNADWLLRFMGLESLPYYREGGRLENYRGDPPLSARAFVVLQNLAVRAAANLERFDHSYASELSGGSAQIALYFALAKVPLEELASERGESALGDAFTSALQRLASVPVD